MSLPPSILVYGRDPTLLDTRCWVLESAGFQAVKAVDASEVKTCIESRNFALLMLCHTLSPEDCEDVLAVVDTVQPRIKKLLITANTPVCHAGRMEQTLSAFDGPRALIATAKNLAARA